ncbi:MAG: ABC transporter permease [Actinobacteria bacterium]|nr:ABC transporter permease [Actinomycetota bacterium]
MPTRPASAPEISIEMRTIFFGFTPVALLGRNHPVGIFFSALLFGFLGEASGRLQLDDIPKEIVTIMTGIIVLAVVIINEAVKRWDDRRIQRRAAAMIDEKMVEAAS